jgi:pimeloyl-ACP methyl ester carboxylesterase
MMSVRLCSLVLVAIFASACAAPVGVRPADPAEVSRILTRNILTSGKLSEQTQTLLHLSDLTEAFRDDPEGVLSEAHKGLVKNLKGNSQVAHLFLITLAELSFDHAMKTGDQRYFLASTVYSWAYLFSNRPNHELNKFDARVQLALGIYNRALSRAFTPEDTNRVAFENGLHETPFGTLDIRIDESTLIRGDYELWDFINVADIEVRGLTNRHRRRGIGAPLAAAVRPLDPATPRPPYLPDKIRVPSSAVLFFDDIESQLESGALSAQIKISIAWEKDEITIGSRTLPLEIETSSSLALMLKESSPWETEIKGFFQGDLALASPEGLISLEPYQPGRIPVVLVHGTASSSARWANMVNDLTNDPRIRERFQFWMFSYNTGNPIAYSAFRLRGSIEDLIQSIDPDRKDDALQHMVVIGHSQGGLLTKLTGIDTGSAFWNLYSSDLTPEEIVLSPESRRILEGALLVKPLPGVERLIFISTPHRGSYLAAYGPAKWLSSMVRSPANLVILSVDVMTSNPESEAMRKIGSARGSVSEMSPESDFLETMIDIPVASDIASHSIIALKGWSKAGTDEEKKALKKKGSDGVVKYKSAHLKDVESEFIVDFGHSCQDHPRVISEVRRILFEHIGSDEATFNEIFID